jgi:hypothetical protein
VFFECLSTRGHSLAPSDGPHDLSIGKVGLKRFNDSSRSSIEILLHVTVLGIHFSLVDASGLIFVVGMALMSSSACSASSQVRVQVAASGSRNPGIRAAARAPGRTQSLFLGKHLNIK